MERVGERASTQKDIKNMRESIAYVKDGRAGKSWNLEANIQIAVAEA